MIAMAMKVLPKRRRLFPLLLLLLAVGCGDAGPQDQAPLEESDGPVQVTYGYKTTQTRAGIPEWELHGDTAYRYPGETTIELVGVRMRFFRDGVEHAVLTSRQGVIDEDTKDTVATGNVIVETDEGRRLESERLEWSNEREKIHTKEFVRYTEGDQILTGYGMETDPELNDLEIKSQVEGDFTREEGPVVGGGQP